MADHSIVPDAFEKHLQTRETSHPDTGYHGHQRPRCVPPRLITVREKWTEGETAEIAGGRYHLYHTTRTYWTERKITQDAARAEGLLFHYDRQRS